MRILVLESSTTSAKAMVYDTETGAARTRIRPFSEACGNGAVQNAEQVFLETAACGRALVMETGEPVLVALSATWHGLCLCSRDMQPVTPVYTWQYAGAAGAAEACRRREGFTQRFYQTTGCIPNATYPYFKLLALKETGYHPENFRIVSQAVYNTFRLTGKTVDTECMASGTGFLDLRKKRYASRLLEEAGIPEGALPELVSYDQTYPLSEEGARLLGIPTGTPVLPSSSDGGLNQLSSGGLREGVMTFSAGTSSALRISTGSPCLPERPSVWCYLSPKKYLSGAATSGCCNCIDWFREKAAGGASYQELETDPEKAAGTNTPVFLPFLFGERSPGWNPERLGAFCGIRPEHGRRELYLAIEEGVLFNTYACCQELIRLNGEPEHIRLSGGILHSSLWTRMAADIFRRPMEIEEEAQSSMVGAAVLGMDVLGIRRAEEYMPKTRRVVRPDPERADIYRKKYERYRMYYDGTVGIEKQERNV